MKRRSSPSRINIIATALLAVIFMYGVRLMQLQIVDGKEYLSRLMSRTVRTVSVSAARGEILDRYGRPIAVNRMGYNIIFDGAYFNVDETNTTILKLTSILEEAGEDWNDSLPITVTGNTAVFDGGRESDIESLKKRLGLNTYATLDNVLVGLRKEYGISDKLSLKDQITVAGVRYEMARRGFNLSVSYTFATDVSMSTVIKVSEHGDDLQGVEIVEEAIREYPMGSDLAPHIIGYVGPIYAEEYEELSKLGYSINDTVGKQGIEKAYEEYLRGTDGVRKIELNKNGDVISVSDTKPAVAGDTVILTIDAKLQRAAQNSLQKRILEMQRKSTVGAGKEATSGAVVVVDVKTGALLAAATYPSYDILTMSELYGQLVSDKNNPLFNRAFNGLYSPGSTYKPVVSIAALQNGIINPSSSVVCNHIYTYFEDYQPQCEGWHGAISLNRAMGVSCNVFFYDVGRRTGINAINSIASSLGLGIKTGIELSEAKGQLASPEYKEQHGQQWFPGDVIQASIGQSDNRFSMLQMASFMGTIGNNGVRMQMHLIDSIKSYDLKSTVFKTPITEVARIENTNNCITRTREALKYTSTNGSGRHAFASFKYATGSKTGSPQTSTSTSNAFFTAFGPYDDCEIAVAVVVEGATNGTNAGPIARDIFDAYFSSSANQTPIYHEGVLIN